MYSAANPSQILSGPVASFLFYEQTEKSYHREGFLLGDIIQNETRTITDNDRVQINITKKIKISAVIPCPYYYYCYEGTGKVDVDRLKQFLGSRFDKVVAWYKHQRCSSSRFTLRDKIIHEQMKNIFNTPPELFSCYLLSTEISESHSSRSLTLFIKYQNDEQTNKMNIEITNLSMQNNAYKHSEPVSETFKNICNRLKANNLTTKGIAGIKNIEKELQECMDDVVNGFSDDAIKVRQLETEVNFLLATSQIRKLSKKRSDQPDKPDKNHNDFRRETLGDNEKNSVDALPHDSPAKVVEKQPQNKKPSRGKGRRGRKAQIKENKD